MEAKSESNQAECQLIDQSVISKEMQEYFIKRTNQHIERVANNMKKMIGYTQISQQQLLLRAKLHDVSKFSQQQKQGYVWLTHWHKFKKMGLQYEYPNQSIAVKVKQSIQHHLKNNEHHHQSFGSLGEWNQKVRPIDLVQMVCDWTAMSQQYGQKTCNKWLKQHLPMFQFSKERSQQIWEIVQFLNAKNILC